MKMKLAGSDINKKMAVLMNELSKLPLDSQEMLLNKVTEAKRSEFLSDVHLLDWFKNEIAWYQAFEQ